MRRSKVLEKKRFRNDDTMRHLEGQLIRKVKSIIGRPINEREKFLDLGNYQFFPLLIDSSTESNLDELPLCICRRLISQPQKPFLK